VVFKDNNQIEAFNSKKLKVKQFNSVAQKLLIPDCKSHQIDFFDMFLNEYDKF
jgi:hypothetical protein